MAVGLRQFTSITNDAVSQPILDAENGEVLMHTQPCVSIVLGARQPLSPGTLYVTSKQVIWLSDIDRSEGYAVDFVSITLHAVSRDPDAYPSPCIYTQIDTGDDEDEEEEDEEEDQHQTVDLSRVKEMRLVPSDPSQLETLFEVFCECAELNPEPMLGEDEEEHNWIYSADQLNAGGLDNDAPEWITSANHVNSIGYSNGDHDLAHNVLELQINDQRFADADEMGHEEENDRNNDRP